MIRFRCPDCHAALSLASTGACLGCKRAFQAEDGVLDFLPTRLEESKAREDVVHPYDSTAETWRRLVFNKSVYIREFEERWMEILAPVDGGAFLEIGGGLCYASALMKSHRPGTFVIASDISRRYVQRQSRKVADIMCAPVDCFAAVDGEALPLEDGQLTGIFCHVVMYRLPDPTRMFREVKRVLRPGGVFLAIERAFPSLPYFYRKESAYLEKRSSEAGLTEKARRWTDWERMLRESGMPDASLSLIPGRYLGNGPIRKMKTLVKPVPVAIHYVKPQPS